MHGEKMREVNKYMGFYKFERGQAADQSQRQLNCVRDNGDDAASNLPP